jgi:hypothetical protein
MSDAKKPKPGHPPVVEIVTDVVKIKFIQEDEVRRLLRVYKFGELLGCTAEALDIFLHQQHNVLKVKVLFKVTVFYLDDCRAERKAIRLVSFVKEIPLPIGPDVSKLRFVAEVKDIHCQATPLLDGHASTPVEAVVRFVLVVKGLLREQILVYTPFPEDGP